MKVTKRTHPAKDGWLRLSITLRVGAPLSGEALYDIAGFGRPADYEFAEVIQRSKSVKAVIRRIDHRPRVSAVDAQPVVIREHATGEVAP